jgi:hypothetical protein
MNDDDQSEYAKWQNFIQRQKSTENDATKDQHNITSKKSRNISEALKGLSDEWCVIFCVRIDLIQGLSFNLSYHINHLVCLRMNLLFYSGSTSFPRVS